jgi:2-amino-4-hydroxy-6-hydroxymethyldihydropteridine diphosphokinase
LALSNFIMLHKAYLLLGSNRGDRLQMLMQAAWLIEENTGKIISSSLVYETAPWGFEDETFFLNQVHCIQTLLTPSDLMANLLSIETAIGRKRQGNNYTSRLIDIDILFYDDHIVDHEHLTIPHPRLHQRRFALTPLAEIASDFIHPVLGITIRDLAQQCRDISEVQLFTPDPVSPHIIPG